jgi:endonuclease YncB( thermonuclease family)
VRAPRFHSKACFYESIQARKAKSGLKQLLRRHKVTIKPTGEVDAKGVALARVSINGTNIRARLLKLGLVLPLTRYSTGNPWCEWFLSR